MDPADREKANPEKGQETGLSGEPSEQKPDPVAQPSASSPSSSIVTKISVNAEYSRLILGITIVLVFFFRIPLSLREPWQPSFCDIVSSTHLVHYELGSIMLCTTKQHLLLLAVVFLAAFLVSLPTNQLLHRFSAAPPIRSACTIISLFLCGVCYFIGMFVHPILVIASAMAVAFTFAEFVSDGPEAREARLANPTKQTRRHFVYKHSSSLPYLQRYLSKACMDTNTFLYNFDAYRGASFMNAMLLVPVIVSVVFNTMNFWEWTIGAKAYIVMTTIIMSVFLLRYYYSEAEAAYYSQKNKPFKKTWTMEATIIILALLAGVAIHHYTSDDSNQKGKDGAIDLWTNQFYGVTIGWTLYKDGESTGTLILTDGSCSMIEYKTADIVQCFSKIATLSAHEIIYGEFLADVTKTMIDAGNIMQFESNTTLVVARYFPASNRPPIRRIIVPRCVYDINVPCNSSRLDVIGVPEEQSSVTVGGWRRDVQKIHKSYHSEL